MKVALVHDYLNQSGGAELTLRYLHRLFPDAPVFTLIYDPELAPYDFREWDIRPVGWSKYIPFKRQFFRNYAPIYPTMIEQINLTDFDLVISSSYLWAKGVLTRSDTLHISYCYTPMRQAWELYFDYKHSYSRWIRKFVYPFAFNYIRMWDRLAAERVDSYVAISEAVARRIAKFYHKKSTVIYPPVETFNYDISDTVEDYYICLSRLVPYKKIDVAIRAFNKMGKKLLVVGEGNHLPYLRHIAGKNIEFHGFVSERLKARLLSRAKALIYPAYEDFGIVPVESQAAGRPVIALGKAGILESVENGKTGLLFEEQSSDAIIDAVEHFEKMEFDPHYIKERAQRFNQQRFLEQMQHFIEKEWENFQQKKNPVKSGC